MYFIRNNNSILIHQIKNRVMVYGGTLTAIIKGMLPMADLLSFRPLLTCNVFVVVNRINTVIW